MPEIVALDALVSFAQGVRDFVENAQRRGINLSFENKRLVVQTTDTDTLVHPTFFCINRQNVLLERGRSYTFDVANKDTVFIISYNDGKTIYGGVIKVEEESFSIKGTSFTVGVKRPSFNKGDKVRLNNIGWRTFGYQYGTRDYEVSETRREGYRHLLRVTPDDPLLRWLDDFYWKKVS